MPAAERTSAVDGPMARGGRVRRALRALRGPVASGLLAALGLLAPTAPAQAHKASDAYLSWSQEDGRRLLRVDVALRDLDQLVPVDANDDGAITWGELRAARPAIDAAIAKAIRVEGGRCPLRLRERHTVRRGDGHYESMAFEPDCAIARPQLSYRLLEDVDPTHRGLLRQAAGPLALAPGAQVRLDALPARGETRGSAGSMAVTGAEGPTPSASSTPASSSTASGSSADASSGDAMASTAASSAALASTGGTGSAATTTSPDTDADAPAGAASFLREGIRHILDGTDHLLFLLALLLPAGWARGPGGWTRDGGLRATIREVVVLVSTFTLAHSITLALGTLDWLRPPAQPIEVAIAGSIVLASMDNLRPTLRWPRAAVVFVFGLVHGFGFAGVLAEAQLPAAQLIGALLAFNVGVELGQLGFVALALLVLLPLRGWQGYRRWILGAGSWLALAAASVWLAQRLADWIR